MYNEIKDKIKKLKSEKNILVLSHYYSLDEVQEISDFVGDSLELAWLATKSDKNIIVISGVYFMAETVKILNPHKKVLIPDKNAGCPLADSLNVKDILSLKEIYKDFYFVTYINSSALVKAYSDIICTSSSAVAILNSLDANKIVFGPDENLGKYVKKFVKNKEIVLWKGHCPVHVNFSVEELINLKKIYPNAKILAHPECSEDILNISDIVGSTSKLIKATIDFKDEILIIATEPGVIYQMKKISPTNKYIPLPTKFNHKESICVNMKKNTLEKLLEVIENETNEVLIAEEIRQKAYKSLENMIETSKKLGLIK